MYPLISEIWRFISKRRKWQLAFLFILMLASGVAEMMSLGMLVPFLGAVANPQNVMQYEGVSAVASLLGVHQPEELAFWFACAFCVAVLSAGATRLATLYVGAKLSHAIGCDVESEIFRKTLRQPYEAHIARHSSQIISSIEKANLATATLISVLGIISGVIVAASIILVLLRVNAIVAVTSLLLLGSIYVGAIRLTRYQLHRNSSDAARTKTARVKVIQEGLGAIRDIILDGSHPLYEKAFRKFNIVLHGAIASNLLLAQTPRILVEALGTITIAIAAYVVSVGSNFTGGIPLLGALALGAQRLLPTFQQIYQGVVFLKGNQASVEDVLILLRQHVRAKSGSGPTVPLEFKKRITFRGVAFRYKDDGAWILKNLDVSIGKGERVGLVGATGSGKSSLLDLFMGLLSPSDGTILVDERLLTIELQRAWQENISHVPQNIYLADATMAENIAFGVSKDRIDMALVQKAARDAQIAEFIESQPEGYSGVVGERGVRLSGGQRQRIGLARALYKQAPILVLDEATSALDVRTEQKVITAIQAATEDCTMLIVSHRLSVLRYCDAIYELAEGRLSAVEYEALLTDSFRDRHPPTAEEGH